MRSIVRHRPNWTQLTRRTELPIPKTLALVPAAVFVRGRRRTAARRDRSPPRRARRRRPPSPTLRPRPDAGRLAQGRPPPSCPPHASVGTPVRPRSSRERSASQHVVSDGIFLKHAHLFPQVRNVHEKARRIV